MKIDVRISIGFFSYRPPSKKREEDHSKTPTTSTFSPLILTGNERRLKKKRNETLSLNVGLLSSEAFNKFLSIFFDTI